MVYLRERAIALVISNVALTAMYAAFLVWPDFFIHIRGGVTFGGGVIAVLVGGANFVAWARFVLGIGDAADTTTAALARIEHRLDDRPRRTPGASSASSASEAFPVDRPDRKAPDGGIGWPD